MKAAGKLSLGILSGLTLFYLVSTGCATIPLPGFREDGGKGKLKSCPDTTIQVIRLDYVTRPKDEYFEDDLRRTLVGSGYQLSDKTNPDLEIQIEYNEFQAKYRNIYILFLLPFYNSYSIAAKEIEVTFKTDKCSQNRIYRSASNWNIDQGILSDIKKLEGKGEK